MARKKKETQEETRERELNEAGGPIKGSYPLQTDKYNVPIRLTNKEGKMYNVGRMHDTSIEINRSQAGEFIEEKVMRIMYTNAPITDGAPIIHTERKDGVLPEYDVRTDKWEVASEAKGKVAQMWAADRERRQNPEKPAEGGTKPEGTTGTEGGKV